MMRALGGRLLAVLLGLVLFWTGAEVASRLLFRQIICFDVEMWRYARQVKAVGLTPGLRFEHRPGAQARLMGVEVAINADGLREREIARTKMPGVIRIAVVGDSITFGWGVSQDQTYPRQLEAELNRLKPLGAQWRFEVLNFGVGNYAVDDVVAMLERKALAYNPDLIVYGAFINDAETVCPAREFILLRHSVFAVWLWGRLDALWRKWGWREDFRTYYNDLYGDSSPGPRLVRAGLKRMATLSEDRGVPLLVVLLPELHADAATIFMPARKFFRQAAVEVGATFLDLHGVITGERPEQYWVSSDDAHPNARACRLYAESIAGGVLRWAEEMRAKEYDRSP